MEGAEGNRAKSMIMYESKDHEGENDVRRKRGRKEEEEENERKMREDEKESDHVCPVPCMTTAPPPPSPPMRQAAQSKGKDYEEGDAREKDQNERGEEETVCENEREE